VLPGRTVLAAIALAVMAAASPQATAEEWLVPRASAGEDTASPKPAEDGESKANPGEEPVPKSRLVSILGREITNREGDSGRVIDVLVDLDGRSGAVVVEFGGFMGIGSRKIAVDWGALRFMREGDRSLLTVDVSREQIRDTPEYKPNEPPAVLTTKAK
jgi:PRC-barrel domain protein